MKNNKSKTNYLSQDINHQVESRKLKQLTILENGKALELEMAIQMTD